MRGKLLVLVSLLAAGQCAMLKSGDQTLTNDLTSLGHSADPVETDPSRDYQSYHAGAIGRGREAVLEKAAATQNMTQTDAHIALEKAKASEERMQVRLAGALKAVDYCHHAQSMLTGEQQEKSMRMQKFVEKQVAKALEDKREESEKTEQALDQCRKEAIDKARLGPDCTKQELAAIRLKSGHKICQSKLKAMKTEMKQMKDNHKAEIDKLAAKEKGGGEKKDTKKKIKKAAKKLNEEEMDQLSRAQQHINILKDELSARTKEKASAKMALRNLQADCHLKGPGKAPVPPRPHTEFGKEFAPLTWGLGRKKDDGGGGSELSEARGVLEQGRSEPPHCAQLRGHTEGVCSIVGATHPSCQQLNEVLVSRCSNKLSHSAEEPRSTTNPNRVQMLQE